MNAVSIFLLSTPFLISILIVNIFFSSESITLTEQAENAAIAGNYFKTEKAYNQLIEAAPLNIEHHRGKIRSHFNIPKKSLEIPIETTPRSPHNTQHCHSQRIK